MPSPSRSSSPNPSSSNANANANANNTPSPSPSGANSNYITARFTPLPDREADPEPDPDPRAQLRRQYQRQRYRLTAARRNPLSSGPSFNPNYSAPHALRGSPSRSRSRSPSTSTSTPTSNASTGASDRARSRRGYRNGNRNPSSYRPWTDRDDHRDGQSTTESGTESGGSEQWVIDNGIDERAPLKLRTTRINIDSESEAEAEEVRRMVRRMVRWIPPGASRFGRARAEARNRARTATADGFAGDRFVRDAWWRNFGDDGGDENEEGGSGSLLSRMLDDGHVDEGGDDEGEGEEDDADYASGEGDEDEDEDDENLSSSGGSETQSPSQTENRNRNQQHERPHSQTHSHTQPQPRRRQPHDIPLPTIEEEELAPHVLQDLGRGRAFRSSSLDIPLTSSSRHRSRSPSPVRPASASAFDPRSRRRPHLDFGIGGERDDVRQRRQQGGCRSIPGGRATDNDDGDDSDRPHRRNTATQDQTRPQRDGPSQVSFRRHVQGRRQDSQSQAQNQDSEHEYLIPEDQLPQAALWDDIQLNRNTFRPINSAYSPGRLNLYRRGISPPFNRANQYNDGFSDQEYFMYSTRSSSEVSAFESASAHPSPSGSQLRSGTYTPPQSPSRLFCGQAEGGLDADAGSEAGAETPRQNQPRIRGRQSEGQLRLQGQPLSRLTPEYQTQSGEESDDERAESDSSYTYSSDSTVRPSPTPDYSTDSGVDLLSSTGRGYSGRGAERRRRVKKQRRIQNRNQTALTPPPSPTLHPYRILDLERPIWSICKLNWPASCGTKHSTREDLDRDEFRKVISHILGRNKRETKILPDWVWTFYCRPHYQRARYRSPPGVWEDIQCTLLLDVLKRLRAWGKVTGFTVQLRRREVKRLEEVAAAATSASQGHGQSQELVSERRNEKGGGGENEDEVTVQPRNDNSGHNDDDNDNEEVIPITQNVTQATTTRRPSNTRTRARAQSTASNRRAQGQTQTQRRPSIPSPVPSWLREDILGHEGEHSFEEVERMIGRIQEYVETGPEGTQRRFPDIEILPRFVEGFNWEEEDSEDWYDGDELEDEDKSEDDADIEDHIEEEDERGSDHSDADSPSARTTYDTGSDSAGVIKDIPYDSESAVKTRGPRRSAPSASVPRPFKRCRLIE